ncbi:MAG: ACT domain-containing protein [Lachnospiraceae bacterium]|nr:ACT domain-containing protein [Lachnospiraceae bacterium]
MTKICSRALKRTYSTCYLQSLPKFKTGNCYGWKAFRIQGILDFSLIGILSRISAALADNQIGIFVISTLKG